MFHRAGLRRPVRRLDIIGVPRPHDRPDGTRRAAAGARAADDVMRRFICDSKLRRGFGDPRSGDSAKHIHYQMSR